MFLVSALTPKLEINLPSSKSHYNRALILNEQLTRKVKIEGAIESTDVQELKDALYGHRNGQRVFKFKDGGTTIRFFTAYVASTNKEEIEIHVSSEFNRRPNRNFF